MRAPKIEHKRFPGSRIRWIYIYSATDTPHCPLCGYPAELLLHYHCTNEECQNYDSDLIEPCPTAGETEFDTEEDTLKLWPEEDEWWPAS